MQNFRLVFEWMTVASVLPRVGGGNKNFHSFDPRSDGILCIVPENKPCNLMWLDPAY